MTDRPRVRSSQKPKNICIVAGDVIEWGPRIDVGASMAAIAETLVSEGNQVTLLWVPDTQLPSEDEVNKLKNYYYDYFLITLEVLTESRDLLPLKQASIKAAAVYIFLKEHRFNAVYFSLEGGLSYHTMVGKETGLFEPRPALAVVAHSPIQWISESDQYFLHAWDQVAVAHMEKVSVELADHLICVSKDTLNWMKSRDWRLPGKVDVLPPLTPSQWSLLPDSANRRASTGKFDEIALLAAPYYRDGLTLFCDAIDELAKTETRNLKLTIFGPFGRHLGEHTGGLLLRRARRWPFEVQFLPRLWYREILEYLSANQALAVVPSLASATGHWVSTCLDCGIPIVATDVGANGELLSPASRASQLVRPEAKRLAAGIASALTAPRRAAPLLEPEARRAAWLDVCRAIDGASEPGKSGRKSSETEPLVSVVLVHHDRPHYLMQAITSIERQSYTNIEVLLVDDGSELPESKALLDRLEAKFAARNWKILRQSNKHLGAARNAGIRESRGEFVQILDDDNALFRDGLLKFVRAMQASGADICTAFHRIFSGDVIPRSERQGKMHYLPLGSVLDLGLIGNTFGDANAMMRRTVFERIGFQIEQYGYTAHDWEFFARAALAGLKQRVIPEPLYWYRSSTQAMYRSSHWYENRLPVLAAFKRHEFRGLDLLYELAISAFTWEDEVNSFRENLRRSSAERRHLRLSELEPNSNAAMELLAEIAAAEGRPDTALILLGRAQVSEFRTSVVDRLSAQPFLDATPRELAAGLATERRFSHRDMMTMEAAVSSPSAAVPLFYVEAPDKCFLQSAGGNTSIAVLPAGCPASTVSGFLTASLEQEFAAPAEVLLMFAPFHLDPMIAVQAAKRTPAEGSSGWCPVSRPYVARKVEAVLSAPSAASLNLIVAVRQKDPGPKAVLACFSGLGLKISLGQRAIHRPRLGPPPSKHRTRSVSRDELSKAQLVSRFPSQLPLLLLDPGDGGIFLRPTKSGPTVASIEYGLPPLARGLIGQVEIAHDAASPFEFALALVQGSSQIAWTSEKPSNCLAFSGWVRVEEAYKLHDISVTLPVLSGTALHILLAIRLPPGSSPLPANSFWRKLVLVWDE